MSSRRLPTSVFLRQLMARLKLVRHGPPCLALTHTSLFSASH
jgi:hypothetical protein